MALTDVGGACMFGDAGEGGCNSPDVSMSLAVLEMIALSCELQHCLSMGVAL